MIPSSEVWLRMTPERRDQFIGRLEDAAYAAKSKGLYESRRRLLHAKAWIELRMRAATVVRVFVDNGGDWNCQ
jgi:hypothetical protein